MDYRLHKRGLVQVLGARVYRRANINHHRDNEPL